MFILSLIALLWLTLDICMIRVLGKLISSIYTQFMEIVVGVLV